ncbi:MAG: sugar ABC transporter permease [Sphaerochaeta sp.]|nr:sugar ABC transporter permease [Sphaerochaeta sp.]
MRLSEKRKTQLFLVQLMLPGVLLVGFFLVYPIAKSFVMSVTNWHLLRAADGHYFVGFYNFREFFGLTYLKKTFTVTALFELVSVVGTIGGGMLIALLLNKKFWGRTIIRGISMLPWAIPAFVVCQIFLLSFNGDYGMLSKFLTALFGMSSSSYLATEVPAFIVVSFIHIWKAFPFVSVMLLAALSTVPGDLYEAASIDGANKWRQFFSITLPSISPTVVTLVIMQAMASLRTFDIVYLLTEGGPNYATNVIGNDIYVNGFKLFKMGMASAEGVVLFVISMFFVIPYFMREGKEIS